MPNLAIFALPFRHDAMGSERMLEHVLASLNRHAALIKTPGGTCVMWILTGMRCASRTQVNVGLTEERSSGPSLLSCHPWQAQEANIRRLWAPQQ
jgi:hypothetical protein